MITKPSLVKKINQIRWEIITLAEDVQDEDDFKKLLDLQKEIASLVPFKEGE